ncbi:MAG TPA: acyl-phosphate glycerol 3-phosphate acyltransferase [Rhodospirillaceae bacterium]|nr:acyl-phosphate glycerol 3-phosphate acyltransferase [Rhodospirillaceae bacterium]HAT35888.1 acyl-phosphate glycerol 3-phosphate acyltransferase [Rhodospirillaceae bacterium]
MLDTPFPFLAVVAALGYFLGSIPFGLIFTKLAGHGDIRDVGSGNIGATNVLRTGNKAIALATLIFDAGKGAAAVLLAAEYGDDAVMVAAIAVMTGHIFPIWLGFKGGKGVATGGGIFLAMAWPVGLGALASWIITAIVSRYSSLAALVAVALTPLFAYLWAPQTMAATVVLALLIVYRHKDNIERLLAGTESRIGAKK